MLRLSARSVAILTPVAEEVVTCWVAGAEADEVVAALEVQPNGMSIGTSSPRESISAATRDLCLTLPLSSIGCRLVGFDVATVSEAPDLILRLTSTYVRQGRDCAKDNLRRASALRRS